MSLSLVFACAGSIIEQYYNSVHCFRAVDIAEQLANVAISSSDGDTRFCTFCKCFSFHNLQQTKTVMNGAVKTSYCPHRYTSTACAQQCQFALSSSQQAKEEGSFFAQWRSGYLPLSKNNVLGRKDAGVITVFSAIFSCISTIEVFK